MKKTILKLITLSLVLNLIASVSYANCSYYNVRSIDAVNATQIGILGGALYSEVTISVEEPGIFNLALVSITEEQWRKAQQGKQVILTGNKICECELKADTSPYSEGDYIPPFELPYRDSDGNKLRLANCH